MNYITSLYRCLYYVILSFEPLRSQIWRDAYAGNILAQTSITLGGGTLTGRALAIGGAVTISVAENINVPEPATIALLGFGVFSLLKKRRA